MIDVLKGEFFWGIVIGLLVSFFGGVVLAKFTILLTQRHQKKTVREFCIDVITNLQEIIKELDDTRDRAKAIHHDFLGLIEVEITVYGRNREHIILLDKSVRDAVRKFMNDCAIQRAQVVNKLDQFYRLDALANQIQAEGRGPEAERMRQGALIPLDEANKATDKLIRIAEGAKDLLVSIQGSK